MTTRIYYRFTPLISSVVLSLLDTEDVRSLLFTLSVIITNLYHSPLLYVLGIYELFFLFLTLRIPLLYVLGDRPIGYGPFLDAHNNSPFLVSRFAQLDPDCFPIARLLSGFFASFRVLSLFLSSFSPNAAELANL